MVRESKRYNNKDACLSTCPMGLTIVIMLRLVSRVSDW